MNQFKINKDRSFEQDKVFLVDRLFHKIDHGEIYPISDLQIIANLNGNWECSFTVYKETNGIINPLWDKITDLALVKIENKGIFELSAPITDENCTYKRCAGKSICEVETSQTSMTLEINTEDDIAREDYYEKFPTVLYRDINDLSVFNGIDKFSDTTLYTDSKKKQILRQSSLLHRVFSEMPEYLENINGNSIDDSLKNIQCIFSWDNTSVYDILQQISEEIECIFLFDKFSRSFAVRDLKDHCETDGCRDIENGVCPTCQANGTTPQIKRFGEYSGVEIDTKNLAETIELTGDADSVKNYFKIEGADDVITNRISNRLIGNGYLWKLGTLQKAQMTDDLVNAIEAREQMMAANNYQETYDSLWDQWNALEEKILDYKSGMMPSPETADDKAEEVFNALFGNNGKIDYAYASNRYQSAEQIADSIMNYAKLLISTNHTVEYTNLSSTTETWNGHTVVATITCKVHIYLDGYYVDDDESKGYVDEYTSPSAITLKVAKGYDVTYTTGSNAGIYTTDYYNYLKRLIDTANAKSDITDEVITFEPETPYDIDPTATSYNGIPLKSTHYSKYCYNRLDSFCKAYEACSAVVAGVNGTVSSDSSTVDMLKYLSTSGSVSNIQDDLLGKYQSYMTMISARMQWLNDQISAWETEQDTLLEQINEIKEICDMENCINDYASKNNITRNLWYELCSFKRQDTYRNENFIGEGIDESTLMQNIEDLIKRAEEEIDKACNITYSASATIDNLLVMPEFEQFWDKFTLGNYIHMIIDDRVHTLRLISITYDYSDLSHCSVEFSDVVNQNSPTDTIKNIIAQAASMATTAKTVARQAEEGAKAQLSVSTIQNDALNLANSRITTADDQSFTIDRYGITGRMIDEVSGEVSPEQIKIINNLLCFTDDSWAHTKTALGKITYLNPETQEYETSYGLIADTLIGNLMMSESLYISDGKGTTLIDGNGIKVTNGYLFLENDKNSIEINPEKDSIFTITKKKDNTKVVTLDSNGNAQFTGTITAQGGSFTGGVLLNGGYLTTSASRKTYNAQVPGLTLDGNGIGSYQDTDHYFNLSSKGILEAVGGKFSGDITGSNGVFSGSILADQISIISKTPVDATYYADSFIQTLFFDNTGLEGRPVYSQEYSYSGIRLMASTSKNNQSSNINILPDRIMLCGKVCLIGSYLYYNVDKKFNFNWTTIASNVTSYSGDLLGYNEVHIRVDYLSLTNETLYSFAFHLISDDIKVGNKIIVQGYTNGACCLNVSTSEISVHKLIFAGETTTNYALYIYAK